MGVEPTGAGITDARTVLKTGEATGPLPPPGIPRRSGEFESSTASCYASDVSAKISSPYFSTRAGPNPGRLARATWLSGRD